MLPVVEAMQDCFSQGHIRDSKPLGQYTDGYPTKDVPRRFHSALLSVSCGYGLILGSIGYLSIYPLGTLLRGYFGGIHGSQNAFRIYVITLPMGILVVFKGQRLYHMADHGSGLD
jgi:hypothetical protein